MAGERGVPHDVHVDPVVGLGHAVGRDVVEHPREVEPHAVRQVTAVGQVQAEDRVARGEELLHDRGIRAGAGVRLHVGVLGTEQLLGALPGELLSDVDLLAAAVVPLPGVALGVLVGQHAALGLQDRARGEVLAGDHLQRPALAGRLTVQDGGDLGVDLGQGGVGHAHGALHRRQSDPGPRRTTQLAAYRSPGVTPSTPVTVP